MSYEDTELYRLPCSEDVCENCGKGPHRVIEWWDERCEGCGEWGCMYHGCHWNDESCTCLLDDWVPEGLAQI